MSKWNPFEKKTEGDGQSKSEGDQLIDKMSEKFGEIIEAKFKPLQETVTGLKTEWDGIKEAAAKEAAPDPNKNTDGSDKTAEQRAEEARVATFALTVTTNARITENDVLLGIANSYPQIIESARKIFLETPWQRKGQQDYAQYCSNVVDMLVGREAKKNGLRYNAGTGKFLIEDSSTRRDGKSSIIDSDEFVWQNPTKPGQVLTGRQQLQMLGIDPDKFAEEAERGNVS